jgi:hypothetical protein
MIHLKREGAYIHAGRPDEFVKNSPKLLPKPYFVKNNAQTEQLNKVAQK